MSNIEFAPLRIPFSRRLQTASIVTWICLYPFLVSLFLLLLSFRVLLPFCLAYLVFLYLDRAPIMGGRKLMWFRRLSIWKLMRDYFPVKLVKTVHLDSSKNYVFGYHPHGIIGLGAWINFATEANGFSSKFPGIDLNLLTLASNFNMPFARDVLLCLGICSVTKISCDNILAKKSGSSIMIVVGGANETVNARPGSNDLVIKKRLGFIKLALRSGSSLVPVFSFGENDLWDQYPNPKGSWLRKFQDIFRSYTGVVPPAIHGRSIFTYNFGLLPYRKQIVSVVGKPIDCPKIADPSYEVIREYQQKYMDELMSVYDKYKDEYLPDRIREMQFVE